MSFQAGNILFQRATSDDDATLCTLARSNPMDGWVRISLERRPGRREGLNLMGPSFAVLARDTATNDRAVGMYECSFLPAWLNGATDRVGYLGGLRVDPAYRNRLRLLKQGFASIREVLETEAAGISTWFTSIADDNRAALRILEAGLEGMPHYQPIGKIESQVISTRQARFCAKLRPAAPADISALADLHECHASAFQFSARPTRQWLRRLNGDNGLKLDDFLLFEQDGRLIATIAVWDQRPFKWTAVHGYRFPLNCLRPAYNLLAALRCGPSLPAAGAMLNGLFMAFPAWRPEVRADTLVAMVRGALWDIRRRKGRIGIIGLPDTDPMTSILRSRLRPVVYRTRIEQVTLAGTRAFPLDGRLPLPEIAIL